MNWKDFGQELLADGRRLNTQILDSSTRLTLNTLFPREFDFYMVTLELVDYNDVTLEYFTFPINPQSMTKTQPYLKQIDRSYGAIIVNKTGMFVPQDLVIRGTFGRQFKFISREAQGGFSVLNFSKETNEFNTNYKSGYGCFKILQDICDKADKLDNGHARKLFFHNLALGENYLVEVISLTPSQDVGTNMIWTYDLRLRILTEINSLDKWKEWGRKEVGVIVTKTVNAAVAKGKQILSGLLKG